MTAGIPSDKAWKLLNLLADGEFHSGEIMAGQLGMSRASVFNALSQAAECDVVLQRVRGKGYRLPRPWQRLDRDEVLHLLGKDAGQFDIEIIPHASSSNLLLLQRAALHPANSGRASNGTVLAVELQTGGRGRMGRSWHSGLGTSLTFSLLWRFTGGLNALSGLSLAVGVAQVRALSRLGAQGVGLKWPNDILAAQGKLGGVLIEAHGDMLGPSAVVIGIGLNYILPAELARRIDQPACALEDVCAAMPTRNQLLATVLQELASVLRQFEVAGFALLRDEWERYHIHQNGPVRVRMADGRTLCGTACGVSDTGELRLDTSQGVRCLNTGEVEGIPG